jgi:phenylalanyl-tRNA synthetase beta chain
VPVITIEHRDLEELVGHGMTVERLLGRLEMIGAVVERRGEDSFDLEVFPDRPDLFSVEGLARAMRAFFDLEPGLKEYKVASPVVELRVDPSVLPVRPVICCGVVRGLHLDDAGIRSLMDFQEKLHLTVGRKRRKVSIGIHDMRDLVPPYTYLGADPTATRFLPLQGDREMDMEEILRGHPKGVEHAWILDGKDRYPLIRDAKGQVLSFPPIINGTVTAVRDDSEDLFMDVTGLEEVACRYSLNILATMLAERGGRLEAVTVSYPERALVMPDLTPASRRVGIAHLNKWTGLGMPPDEVVRSLQRMGMDAKLSKDKRTVAVRAGAWRMDIMHDVDIAEDVAIGYGYDKVKGILPERVTFGVDHPTEALERRVHESLRGRGYTEVMSLVITSEEEQYGRMRLPQDAGRVTIVNPVAETFTTLRTHLLPDLLAYLGRNTHHEYPQSVYELGEVVGEGARNHLRAAAAHVQAKAGFTLAKSLAEGLGRDLGLAGGMAIEAEEHPSFIPGRCARVVAGGKVVGRFGEVHPEVLEAFGIAQPTIAIELDLEAI